MRRASKRSKPSQLAGLLALGAVLTACAAAERSAAPQSPASAGSAAKTESQRESEEAGNPPPPPPPPQPSAGTSGFARPPADGERAREAWLDLTTAEGQLDATMGDCALACKALASMDRAASHVCVVAPDESHCGSARTSLKNARRRVRAECTVCPNGISVDPEAPIPSEAGAAP